MVTGILLKDLQSDEAESYFAITEWLKQTNEGTGSKTLVWEESFAQTGVVNLEFLATFRLWPKPCDAGRAFTAARPGVTFSASCAAHGADAAPRALGARFGARGGAAAAAAETRAPAESGTWTQACGSCSQFGGEAGSLKNHLRGSHLFCYFFLWAILRGSPLKPASGYL